MLIGSVRTNRIADRLQSAALEEVPPDPVLGDGLRVVVEVLLHLLPPGGGEPGVEHHGDHGEQCQTNSDAENQHHEIILSLGNLPQESLPPNPVNGSSILCVLPVEDTGLEDRSVLLKRPSQILWCAFAGIDPV